MSLVPRRPAQVEVVALAGYGKSTSVERELPLDAARLDATEVSRPLRPTSSWIAVDGVDRLDDHDRATLLRRVDEVPEGVGVVLVSRRPLPGRGLEGRAVCRSARDLALSEYDVARVLSEEYDLDNPELAVALHRATRGWPALVHLVADRVPPTARTVDVVAAAGWVRGWLERQVLPDVPADELSVLRRVLPLGPVVPPLLSPATITRLEVQGLLWPEPGGGWRPAPLVAQCLSDPSNPPEPLDAAATAYETAGLWAAAARAFRAVGDRDRALELVASRGDDMLRQGHALDLIELVDESVLAGSDRAAMLRADAWRIVGDGARATREFAALVAAADRTGDWSRELATRASAVPFMHGDAEGTLALLDRCPEPVEDGGAGDVDWLAQRTHCLVLLGDVVEAARCAESALRLAEADGGPRALLAAHLAMARAGSGARKAAHHERAAEAAAACGDLLALARVRTNQAHHLLATARYAEALVPAREAVTTCEAVSPPGMLCAAIHNLAEALARTGSPDEATWYHRRTVVLGGRLGPGRTALGVLGTAQVQHGIGRTEQARAGYRDAVDLARRTGEVQVLVPALSGLARLDADPTLAEEALRVGTPATASWALAATAWVARDHGLACDAVSAARASGSLDQLAEALEVAALTTEDPAAARVMLSRARAIWQDGGATPASARIDVRLARLPDADALDRARAGTAVAYLQRLGVAEVDGVPLTAQLSRAAVRIHVLGGFSVRVEGTDVPLTAWRSRQARSLVKILVARRGRPTSRAALAELLWPDDDPRRTGHRLSVLLATVRGVLDPGKRWPTDRFVASDRRGVWLELAHVDVDAEELLRDVDLAAAEQEAGRDDRAAEILVDLDVRHRGEALEDEAGEPWADALREEVRAAYLRMLQLLVAIRRGQGRRNDVARLLVRLLASDPYDERAHRQLVRTLVAARRHGEARRAFERWSAAMAELDAPEPDPRLLGVPVLTPR